MTDSARPAAIEAQYADDALRKTRTDARTVADIRAPAGLSSQTAAMRSTCRP
ncbi:MAG: hypothetical protein H6926_07380 [Chromatiales bacterium]|nr:hypothetical protein [Chromatiales bacterium]